jgi:hypothetical protein
MFSCGTTRSTPSRWIVFQLLVLLCFSSPRVFAAADAGAEKVLRGSNNPLLLVRTVFTSCREIKMRLF